MMRDLLFKSTNVQVGMASMETHGNSWCGRVALNMDFEVIV